MTRKALILVLIIQFFSCDSNSKGVLKFNDKYSEGVSEMIVNYSQNNQDNFKNIFSDSIAVYFNDKKFIGLNRLMSEFKNDHIVLSNILIENLETFTLFFDNNEFITEQSFEWNGKGNFSNNNINTQIHISYYWENDIITKIISIFDYEDYIREIELSKNIKK